MLSINCDLGEGLDAIDAQIMPFIDQANIACGGHAGDAESMQTTIELALQHGVTFGAHPSYPDRENFGRKSLDISYDALFRSLLEQTEKLSYIARGYATDLAYIKPHGALYNDANKTSEIRRCLFQLARECELPLMLQALPPRQDSEEYLDIAALDQEAGSQEDTLQKAKSQKAKPQKVRIIYEAFADRAYTDKGLLVSRQHAHSVHTDLETILQQVRHLAQQGGVYSENQQWLPLNAQTLCVHSDTKDAVNTVKSIRSLLSEL